MICTTVLYREFLSVYVYSIQRAWRSYSKKKHFGDPDSDDNCSGELEELKILHDGSEKMTHTTPECATQSENVKVTVRDTSLTNVAKKRNNSSEKDHFIHKRSSSEEKEHNPSARLSSPAHRLVNKVRYEHDSDSMSSDYSEVSAPLKDLADAEVTIIEKRQLAEGNIPQSSRVSPSSSIRKPFESDEEFSRRIRKLNFLSIAQEFAELKKVNSDILPFDLHKGQQLSESSCSDSTSSAPTSEMNTPSDPSDSFVQLNNGVNNLMSKDLNSNVNNGNVDGRNNSSLSTATKCSNNNVGLWTSTTDGVSKRSSENSNKGGKANIDEGTEKESDGDFDVYNIETALPPMNWEMLEQQLQQVTQNQLLLRQQQLQQSFQPQPVQKTLVSPHFTFINAKKCSALSENISFHVHSGFVKMVLSNPVFPLFRNHFRKQSAVTEPLD